MVGVRRVLLIAALVAVVMTLTGVAYSRSGRTHVDYRDPAVADGVNVAIDLVAVATERHTASALVTLFPAGSYRDARTDTFAKTVRVTSRVLRESSVFQVESGQPVGSSYEITIPLQGNPDRYPLDRYDYSRPGPRGEGNAGTAPLLQIEEVPTDGPPRPVPVGTADDNPAGLVGWSERWRLAADGSVLTVQLTMSRAATVIVAVVVLVLLVIAMAVLSASVAWAVATRRRPVEPTFAGWFAALLFALFPLQNNLPGAPQLGGTWLDVCVFLWVEIVLLVALGVFILSWFRDREPPDDGDRDQCAAASQVGP